MEVAISDRNLKIKKNILKKKKKDYLNNYSILKELDKKKEIELEEEDINFAEKLIKEKLLLIDSFKNIYNYLLSLEENLDLDELKRLKVEINDILNIIKIIEN